MTTKFLQNPSQYSEHDIHIEIYLVKIMQCIQVFDIVLILAKKTKGSLPASIAQIIGRLTVALIFL
jgi:hypothetical protein